ncbi:hypothetical protein [Azorhizophilus paspali]|uniref:Uncharacterized protein n=1 Tax=Azorhizophilus paspali TaxID=69963 RepID=A0ABV6SJ09_AZOPA
MSLVEEKDQAQHHADRLADGIDERKRLTTAEESHRQQHAQAAARSGRQPASENCVETPRTDPEQPETEDDQTIAGHRGNDGYCTQVPKRKNHAARHGWGTGGEPDACGKTVDGARQSPPR